MVTAVGSAATAVTAIGAIYFTARSLEFTAQATRDQLRIAEQGQITDRYSRATDQLGADQIDVRLGAIYSLERIMHDSPPDAPDAATIVEVLSAFVRGHAPIPAPSSTANPTAPWTKPAIDVQAVLTVLGRRPLTVTTRIDLTRANLTLANLVGANLNGAILTHANLSGANLIGAHLSLANLADTDLSRADLTDADLSRAWGVTSAQVARARVSATTRLPQGVTAPSPSHP